MIPPQQGRSRPRKYCEKCRPPRNAPNPRVIDLPKTVSPAESSASPRSVAGAAAGGEPALVARYRARLEVAGQLDTPEGALVMHLAALFAGGAHTSSGAASLSRELRAAYEVAMADAPRERDKLDELAERRKQKASGA